MERGMRVLDLGCRSGDASLIAEMVGPSGLVVRVDGSAKPSTKLKSAQQSPAVAIGLGSSGRIPTPSFPHERFDAVVVRVPVAPR